MAGMLPDLLCDLPYRPTPLGFATQPALVEVDQRIVLFTFESA